MRTWENGRARRLPRPAAYVVGQSKIEVGPVRSGADAAIRGGRVFPISQTEAPERKGVPTGHDRLPVAGGFAHVLKNLPCGPTATAGPEGYAER